MIFKLIPLKSTEKYCTILKQLTINVTIKADVENK